MASIAVKIVARHADRRNSTPPRYSNILSPDYERLMKTPRRRFLTRASALPLTALLAMFRDAHSAVLAATPQDALGPFYPPKWEGEIDADLIAFGGRAYADGTPLTITGVVRGGDGVALASARVEIWQVDATGKYRHQIGRAHV